jgi:ubiquinone/menaquinone biosynthesis C-methylase UbiE
MKKCLLCNKRKFLKKFEYFSPPFGETNYFKNKINYHRYFLTCKNCLHWFSILKFSLKNLYSSEYNKATYLGNLMKNFQKINKLPNKKSDNFYRVKRIVESANKILSKNKKKTLLDIGSGLGIFPYKISVKGFNCTALDPDASSCKHIRKNLKINAINGDFLKKNIKKKFDIVTMNKVIEHVKNPYTMIKKAKKNLNKNGIVYIEVPDATEASKKGQNREEFFVDHLHVFSKDSLYLLLKKASYKKININQIVEPSGKFTIYAFAKI